MHSNKRVLSIQSHVVHGYVGNKSATFPLQVLGFEIDAINSVQFSNHTGYGILKGEVLREKELADLFEGLEKNNLCHLYTHLLTGYVGNISFLQEIARIVKKLKEYNPNLIYVCDPVLGDNGHMYLNIPKELINIYRDEIIPLVDIITPNQFEVELITGNKINTEQDALNAMKWFHERGVKTVVLSSTEIGKPGELIAFLSANNGSKYKITIPKQGGDKISFTGTGDLFASLYLAHSTINENNHGKAFELTTATLQAVIKRTIESIPNDVLDGKRKVTSQERELKLIQSKHQIENPDVILKAINI